MRWRGVFRIIHRDVGYVAVALTIAYALSGIAVNHIEDWNPNYSESTRTVDIGAAPSAVPTEIEAHVLARLGIARASVRGHFAESATDFRVFLVDGGEVRVDPNTGKGSFKELSRRAVLFEVNALHLNNLKGVWTYVADLFAIAMLVLAITGMTMMKGKQGFMGRGKYFVLGGLSIPITFVIYLYSH